jgi:hypothetical protein
MLIERSGHSGAPAPAHSSDATCRTGLRRIDWVRLVVDSHVASAPPVRAEAIGVGYRLPVTCPIPLSLAADLIASGTPYVSHVVAPEDRA